jgi:hypothetical protein
VNKVSYEDIVKKVKEHFNLKPSKIMEQFNCNSCVHLSGENIATFVAEIRHLTEHCEIGDSLEDRLLDRFICGVNNGRIQRRLLAETKLTFATAIQLAQSMEAAERDAQNLQQKPRSVLAVETSVPSHGTGGMLQPCYRCAGKHMSRDCCFKDFVCNHCGKKGNIARACRSKKDSQPKPRGRRRSHTANVLEEEDKPTEIEEVMYNDCLFHLAPLTATVRVNSAALRMEIDTGVSVSVISESTYRSSLWSDRERPPLQNTTAHPRTYTGEPIAILRQLEYGTQKRRLKLHGDSLSLLGRD